MSKHAPEPIYHNVFRLAHLAALESGKSADLHAVWKHFEALYPYNDTGPHLDSRGRDRSAARHADAVRMAWARALLNPPRGLDVQGTVNILVHDRVARAAGIPQHMAA